MDQERELERLRGMVSQSCGATCRFRQYFNKMALVEMHIVSDLT